jgi:hypothetical protein
MRRLSRELISALLLSFEAWPDVAASGFRRGACKGRVHARNRVVLVFIFYPRFYQRGCGEVITNLGCGTALVTSCPRGPL